MTESRLGRGDEVVVERQIDLEATRLRDGPRGVDEMLDAVPFRVGHVDRPARPVADVIWRRVWDLNPRRLSPHTLSKRAHSAALATLRDPLGAGSGSRGYRDLSNARSGVWRSGPVQREPVNRVRAGRQQLSAGPAVCRRSPGRHSRERAFSGFVQCTTVSGSVVGPS